MSVALEIHGKQSSIDVLRLLLLPVLLDGPPRRGSGAPPRLPIIR